MTVVIDLPFYNSLGKFVKIPHLSNADIVWFVVDYDLVGGGIKLVDTVFTTLENSVEALTAGIPLSLESFENQMSTLISGTSKKARNKIIRL